MENGHDLRFVPHNKNTPRWPLSIRICAFVIAMGIITIVTLTGLFLSGVS